MLLLRAIYGLKVRIALKTDEPYPKWEVCTQQSKERKMIVFETSI